MPDWREVVRRRVPPRGSGRREAEAREELAEHLADRYRDARARGESEEAAGAAALAELEPLERTQPRARAFPGRSSLVEPLWRDMHHGLRLMRRAPGFTAVAVVTLALAIGANTAVFSLVNAVLLRPLPFPEPSRLVVVTESVPALGFPVLPFGVPDYEDYARRQRSFESVALYQNARYELGGGGEAERVDAARVSASLFRVLGVAPRLGRTFTEEEDRPGTAVVVISHGLWQRRFGGSPGALGATLLLDREPRTIVGIMPAGFRFRCAVRASTAIPPSCGCRSR
jgi:hypothetical protein